MFAQNIYTKSQILIRYRFDCSSHQIIGPWNVDHTHFSYMKNRLQADFFFVQRILLLKTKTYLRDYQTNDGLLKMKMKMLYPKKEEEKEEKSDQNKCGKIV